MAVLTRHHPHHLGDYPRRSVRGTKQHELRRAVVHGPSRTHAPVVNLVPEARTELAPLDPLTLDAGDRPLSVFDIPLRPLGWSAPFQWLAAGWQDFVRAPLLGLCYGSCFVAMGWLLLLVFQQAPAYTLALSAGFLLVGPILCLGLYQASQTLASGQPPSLLSSLMSWRTHGGQLAAFGGSLLILEMLWGRAAMIVFALSFDGMPDFQGSVLKLLDPENLGFITAYLAVGAVFAGLIFAISAVSIPMMLERQVDAITAGLTSLRLVTSQTGVMLLWGALITGLVCLAMLPGFLGLLLVGPWLGHASWHAYKAAVGPSPG
ncbi:MAG: DUF2189 domain-containing protein [Rubrivivax sp.]|nr:MAG: DUF2189 domain-containing protein [Rubrivivax sp.]